MDQFPNIADIVIKLTLGTKEWPDGKQGPRRALYTQGNLLTGLLTKFQN